MLEYKFFTYKGYEITRNLYKKQIIYTAYKDGNLYDKQRYIYYTDKEALKLFKQRLLTLKY